MSDDRPNLREVTLDIADDKTRACVDTIGVLEDALARARAGELHGVLVVGELDGGEIISMWTNALDFRKRMGSLELMKLNWMAEISGWEPEGR